MARGSGIGGAGKILGRGSDLLKRHIHETGGRLAALGGEDKRRIKTASHRDAACTDSLPDRTPPSSSPCGPPSPRVGAAGPSVRAGSGSLGKRGPWASWGPAGGSARGLEGEATRQFGIKTGHPSRGSKGVPRWAPGGPGSIPFVCVRVCVCGGEGQLLQSSLVGHSKEGQGGTWRAAPTGGAGAVIQPRAVHEGIPFVGMRGWEVALLGQRKQRGVGLGDAHAKLTRI